MQIIIVLLTLRDPLYSEAEDFIVNTDRLSTLSVAQEFASLARAEDILD
jgi:shikimate kinase